MRHVWSRTSVGLCCIAVLASFPLAAGAQVSMDEEFSNDSDGSAAYEPTTRNPLNDPLLSGAPPSGWLDVRTGWMGVMEENLSTVGDHPTFPAADPGANTPEYAILQPEGGTSSYGWGADASGDTVTFSVDHYADPAIAHDNPNPDMWWTNVVSAGAGYLTETGLTFTVAADGTYVYSTTNGVPIATVPAGSWYEMETIIQNGADGNLDGIHNLWDATHTTLLGSVTLPTLFQNPANSTIGPYYSHFTNFTPNVDAVFIDDFNIVATVAVPEPTSLALLGVGATCLRRRRRH